MSKLIVVVLAGALAAVLFFWRRNEESWSSMWSSAKDSSFSLHETAAHESGMTAGGVAAAADHATAAVSDLADEVKGSASQVAHKAGKAADGPAETAESATAAATNVVNDVKDDNEA